MRISGQVAQVAPDSAERSKPPRVTDDGIVTSASDAHPVSDQRPPTIILRASYSVCSARIEAGDEQYACEAANVPKTLYASANGTPELVGEGIELLESMVPSLVGRIVRDLDTRKQFRGERGIERAVMETMGTIRIALEKNGQLDNRGFEQNNGRVALHG